MRKTLRYAICLVGGTCAALGLFLLMQGLIGRSEANISNQKNFAIPQFIRMDQPEDAVKELQRERPEPLKAPEPVPMAKAMEMPQPPPIQSPQFDPSIPDIRPDLALNDLPLAAPVAANPSPSCEMQTSGELLRYSQPLIPVSRVEPSYPRRAQLEGISGWVRLEFVVSENGSVKDIRVVEAHPRRGIFEMEAVRALSRWTFHPQTHHGKTLGFRHGKYVAPRVS